MRGIQIIIIIALIVHVATAYAQWHVQTLESAKQFSNMTSRSMAINKITGDIHIAYGATHLYYGEYSNGIWQLSSIDNSTEVGQYASIALDSSGNPHISYYDKINDHLKYIHWNGTSWEKPQTLPPRGMGSQIVIGNDDKVYIYSVSIYIYDGTSWVELTVPDGGQYNSIALDSLNNIHLCYNTTSGGSYDSDLKYLKYNSTSGWTTPLTLDSAVNVGSYCSIVCDTLDNVHIYYYDQTNQDLKYIEYRIGLGWGYPQFVIDGMTGPSSICIDAFNNVYISYIASDGSGYKYIKHTVGIGWSTTEDIDSIATDGGPPSIATDADNNPHIIYKSNHRLMHAFKSNNSWISEIIDKETNLFSPSIDLDQEGNIHICYIDSYGGYLKYIKCIAGAGWGNPEIIDSCNSTQLIDKTSIAVDNNDNVHILYLKYYRVELGIYKSEIKYIKHDNESGWGIAQVLDNVGRLYHGKIASDSEGCLHVVYGKYFTSSSLSSTELRYIYDNGTNWMESVILDTTSFSGAFGPVIQYPSITIDNLNNCHVVYSKYPISSEYSELFYISKNAGTWSSTEFLGSLPNQSTFSIDMDFNNKLDCSMGVRESPHSNPGYLSYANYDGSIWDPKTLITGEEISSNSLTIDNNNDVHIIYGTSNDLKYIKQVYGYIFDNPQIIDADAISVQDLDMKSDDYANPRIAYAKDNNLMYASPTDTDSDGLPNNIDPDDDGDGICDEGTSHESCNGSDNCQLDPNSPTGGTCVKSIGGVLIGTGVTCTPGGSECPSGQTCQLEQGDMNVNGIGDACECYADANHDGKVNTTDLGIMKVEFFRTNCATVPCQADLNGDDKVNTSDLGIMKVQFFKTGCPVP